MKTKFDHTDLTSSPLLNSSLRLNGTDTSVVPMLSSEGGEDVGGSKNNNYYYMLKHEKNVFDGKVVFCMFEKSKFPLVTWSLRIN